MATPAIESHAERLLPDIYKAIDGTGDAWRAVIDTVYEDPVIADKFAGSTIQCDTVRATVIKAALDQLKAKTEYAGALGDKDVEIMIIGDTQPPDDIKDEVHAKIDCLVHDRTETIIGERGQSYNLDGRAPEWVREQFMEYIDRHYGFSEHNGLLEQMIKNSSFVAGGMSALRLSIGQMLCDAANLDDDKGKQIPYIIATDTSFDMFWDIAEKTNVGSETHFEKIPTKQKNLLHLTPDEVDEFYKDSYPKGFKDYWYITPISNYPCTKADPKVLHSTCQAIIRHNPDATIVLDCVYLRILEADEARELMAPLLGDAEVMNRILFIESFSKSHGIAGRRVGAYFTTNNELFDSIHKYDRGLGQGHPYEIYGIVSAISYPNEEREQKIREWHMLWGAERKGLYAYLIENGTFDELFHKDQSHILPEQLESTVGIYLSLRLKDGVSQRDVLEKTGIAGIEFEGSGGKWIRFSVGKITEPTYSK